MQVLGISLCASLQFITVDYWFALVYLIVRVLQGSGDALIMVGTYSILAAKFKGDAYQNGLTVINSSIAIGIAMGPSLGSLIVVVGKGEYYLGLLIFAAIQAIIILIANQNGK